MRLLESSYRLRLLISVLVVAVLAACSTLQRRPIGEEIPADEAGSPVVIFVVKRSWHTDIGFDTADLHPPLASVRNSLLDPRYVLFGFGDEHYLLTHGRSFDRLLGAVWPGDGLVLATGLQGTPEEAFGASEVIRLTLSASQARELEQFVWKTLLTEADTAKVLAPGPYDGSVYIASVQRYSGLHTCNTWTAEALRAAGLPVHSFGVEFAGQVWRQVRRISRGKKGDAPLTDASRP